MCNAVPPDVTGALHTILLFLVDTVREVAQNSAANDTSVDYYDAKTSPLGATTFRRAAAAGRFPVFKIGRRLVARRADVDAWIATQARTPKKAQSAAANDVDDAFLSSLRPKKDAR
jgi:hypothetical protein